MQMHTTNTRPHTSHPHREKGYRTFEPRIRPLNVRVQRYSRRRPLQGALSRAAAAPGTAAPASGGALAAIDAAATLPQSDPQPRRTLYGPSPGRAGSAWISTGARPGSPSFSFWAGLVGRSSPAATRAVLREYHLIEFQAPPRRAAMTNSDSLGDTDPPTAETLAYYKSRMGRLTPDLCSSTLGSSLEHWL